jgi:hypothetical protein
MKKIMNPIISLNRKESSNLVKIMNWELKTSLSVKQLKKIYTTWKKLAKSIIY